MINYLLHHLIGTSLSTKEVESLINWAKPTNLEPKKYTEIIEDTTWRNSNAVNNSSKKYS
jgi:hypothetical protein